MTPSVAAGRALYLLEHPGVDPTVWDLTDEPTRDWYVTRAQPIADAAAAAAWDTCVSRMVYSDGTPVDIAINDNPYRKEAS